MNYKLKNKVMKVRGIIGGRFSNNKIKLPKGKYKNVYAYELMDGSVVYQAYIPKYEWSKYFDNEREAAINVDKKRLEEGDKAVNILVPK